MRYQNTEMGVVLILFDKEESVGDITGGGILKREEVVGRAGGGILEREEVVGR